MAGCERESGAMPIAQAIAPQPSALQFVSHDYAEQWYALCTRPRHEKTVFERLRRKDVNTFLPLVHRTHRWSDRHKKVQIPLFPGYAFVRIPTSAESSLLVLRTPGVVRFVGAGWRGFPIPDEQIEALQRVLAHNVSCALFPFLRVGQRVRIRGGCLNGVEGRLVALKNGRLLVISIEPILSSVAISLQGYDVELV